MGVGLWSIKFWATSVKFWFGTTILQNASFAVWATTGFQRNFALVLWTDPKLFSQAVNGTSVYGSRTVVYQVFSHFWPVLVWRFDRAKRAFCSWSLFSLGRYIYLLLLLAAVLLLAFASNFVRLWFGIVSGCCPVFKSFEAFFIVICVTICNSSMHMHVCSHWASYSWASQLTAGSSCLVIQQ